MVEHLPGEKNALEADIVNDFIASLRHFHNRTLVNVRRGAGEFPDFEAEEHHRAIGIELQRMVVQSDEEAHQRQLAYIARIHRKLSDLTGRFAGLSVTFDCRQDLLPPLQGNEGKALASGTADHMREVVGDVEGLALSSWVSYEWGAGPADLIGGAFIWRYVEPASRASLLLGFPGISKTAEAARIILADSLAQKIAKRYAYSGALWLLVWQVGGLMVSHDDESIEQARALLRSRGHPFAEIWHFTPIAGDAIGILRGIWPEGPV